MGRLAHRTRRTAVAALLAAALTVPLSAAARPNVPAPAPAALPPLTPAGLTTAYAANRADATRAARMAAAHGDSRRAAADRAIGSTRRQLLAFDGRGAGLVSEVFGDLAHAGHIAVLVPGSDTSLDTYPRFHRAAEALYAAANRGPGPRTAVVAWLGYRTPVTVSTTVATTTRADEAAPQLQSFVRTLRELAPGAHLSVVCHSYGSVVCGRAAHGLDVADIALVGSPGTGAGDVAVLGTRARVWAARGGDDWVGDVPHVRVDLLLATVGLGADPVSRDFGARVFDAGPADHSGYFTPGSASLANLARITRGETSEVTRG
ncbi:alpha/beta hydrolase [Streptomyces griseofuscus]|uniref:alpha/beta hydrolase n=1 Tax=Streptomyces griseofuscus TaxID=146922 RepID=UPI00371714CC